MTTHGGGGWGSGEGWSRAEHPHVVQRKAPVRIFRSNKGVLLAEVAGR